MQDGELEGGGVSAAKMKCLPRKPVVPLVSWGARAASVYLGVLVSAIAVREGASGKPHSGTNLGAIFYVKAIRFLAWVCGSHF